MSILIKGMDMPTKCSECLFAKLSPTGESLICNYMLSIVSWDERPSDCPLSYVPPHGDLIDKKELSDDLQRRWNVSDDQDFCNKEVWHALEEAPTIIEAEKGD